MSAAINANLKGRVCLVTGANTGIGKAIARGLARLGATVILGCRSAEKGEAARKEIVEDTKNNDVHVMQLDVSSQASIRAFVGDLESRFDKLHVLVNNAGVWTTSKQQSPDGIEMMWATNVLGYHLLTKLLLPRLLASAPARIVNVSSSAVSDIDLTDVQYEKRKYNDFTAYGATKKANRMLTWDLAERLAGKGVTANAGNPGLVRTELVRHTHGFFNVLFKIMHPLMGRTPEKGADTFLWLAASPEVEGVTGKFFTDRKEQPCKFRDPAAIKELVALCDRMTQSA